jgi:hypothetical protein
LDALADTEWNALLATKSEVLDVTATQEFVVGASILARKWKHRVKKYNIFQHHALQIVLELGPPFEGEKIKEEKCKIPWLNPIVNVI